MAISKKTMHSLTMSFSDCSGIFLAAIRSSSRSPAAFLEALLCSNSNIPAIWNKSVTSAIADVRKKNQLGTSCCAVAVTQSHRLESLTPITTHPRALRAARAPPREQTQLALRACSAFHRLHMYTALHQSIGRGPLAVNWRWHMFC